MQDLSNTLEPWLETHLVEVMGAMTLVLLFLVFFLLHVALRLRALSRHYDRVLAGGGGNVREILERHVAKVEQAQAETQELRARLEALAQRQNRCLQNTAVVRYDAFEDVGGQNSFAVALLDANQNGVVFSGIFAREETRTYAKPIRNGRSPLALSEEEQRVITEASR